MLKFISDIAHYDIVLNLASQAKRSLWLGTADIKDLHVKRGITTMPFLGILAELVSKNVEVRLIYAKHHSKYNSLCPRVHFKFVIIDATICYIGSANLTGAGMGMKSPSRRNFEAGVLTNDPAILNPVIEEFDKIWRGAECPHCQRKQFCFSPVI